MLISSMITPQQVVAADSIPSNTCPICILNIQIPANFGNPGVKLRQQTTVLDVVNKGIGDGHVKKENSNTTEDKIKGNTYNYFNEALNGNYEGEQKNQGIWRIWRLYFSESQPQQTPFFLGKNGMSKRSSV